MRKFNVLLKGLAVGFLLPTAVGCGGSGKDGSDGISALVSVTAEAPGANCANGGEKVDYGADTNGNGRARRERGRGHEVRVQRRDGRERRDGRDG